MVYLKEFENHSEYEAFTATTEFIKPNVSTCVSEDDVHYNPIPPQSERYLTFIAKENGSFKFSGNTVQYSLDEGKTWTNLTNNTNSPTVTAGNKIMWRTESGLTPSQTAGIGRFSASTQFDVEGNPMSLLLGDDFKGKTDLTGKNYAFYGLFSGCTNVVSAKNMSLPATTLAEYCYSSMFSGCTSLTTAPALPATTLVTFCYNSMFNGCTSLNYIKAMFTDTPSSTYTSNWVNGVATSGTFVKNSAATWDVTGVNGIPTGWTVETASAS